ncbi:hypothetical protein PMI21_01079 [Pseudomonas sp. GM18]|uniref:hypothetical protein n=1 Tax=Pseudomonas sp. GM18 TaxID=1144324 RepID=UPI000272604D|nr:hypothetical protein [Pseudomonas sp. GM18]EJM20177.1 hypothetical protein PMI21_01079 [Pseudomonas sp. GM18]
MSKLSRMASALSFAHLAGIGSMRGKKARAEDDEDDGRKEARAEDDEHDEDDDLDRDNRDGKRSRKAKRAKSGEDADDDRHEDDDDEHAEDDDDQDGNDDKKSRRAKGKSASDDDDDPDAEDDEDEMHGRSAAANARRRERARCAAIFGSRYAARNPVLAANLAFGTSMTRQQALNVLRDTPADSPAAAGRAARNPNLGGGGDQSPSRQVAIASRWDRAMSKVRR